MITLLKGLSVNHESDVTWFHGFWLVSMFFQGGFMVFLWFLVSFSWFSRWFHGFSLFLLGFHGFFKMVSWFIMIFGWFPCFFQGGFMVYHGFWLVSMVLLVENTTKLYPGQTIQSRPCRP